MFIGGREGPLPTRSGRRLDLRRQATVIARHFPTIENVDALLAPEDLLEIGPDCLDQKRLETWCSELKHGPLTGSTRLRWPE